MSESAKGKGVLKNKARRGVASVFSGGIDLSGNQPEEETPEPQAKAEEESRPKRAKKGAEKNPMGRPALFDEPTKIKAINEPISFLVNLQLLASKRQGKTGRSGNVSELIREVFQPIIEAEIPEEERCKPNEYPDWYKA